MATRPSTKPRDVDDYDFLADDLEAYAESALVIRTKSGAVDPFVFNPTQRALDAELKRQLDETDMVRALVLKMRQGGISTYVGGRFYHKTTHGEGIRTQILTHHDDATANLFEMTRRFHEYCPADLRPITGASSAKELTFPGLNSGYKIGTAGGRAVGRSSTIQLFHGSEVAYWPNAAANLAGIGEAVPLEAGTEVILESTAEKPGDAWHQLWRAAKAGESRYRAVFLPWHIHDEYRQAMPDGFKFPKALEIYGRLHGLDSAQLYWAFQKNQDMAAARGLAPDVLCQDFKREYPTTDDEAFETAGDDLRRAIPMAWIKLAQERWIANKGLPKGKMTALGVDVAGGGNDRTVMAPLFGLRFDDIEEIQGAITANGPAMGGAILAKVRDGAQIGIDMTGGYGGGPMTHLKMLKIRPDPIGVNASNKSHFISQRGRFAMRNVRAHLWWLFHEALDPEQGEPVELPPSPRLAEELAAPTYEIGPAGLLIQDKESIIETLRRSPDEAEAVLIAWFVSKVAQRRGISGNNDLDGNHSNGGSWAAR